MNIFAKFDENPEITLQVIKKTKRYGRTHRRTDNVKTVYPTTNKVCGGYNNCTELFMVASNCTNGSATLNKRSARALDKKYL